MPCLARKLLKCQASDNFAYFIGEREFLYSNSCIFNYIMKENAIISGWMI